MQWNSSEWEKPYKDKYKIIVLDAERIVAIVPLEEDKNAHWAINAGIKDVAKNHVIKDIVSIQKTDGIAEVILLIEPRLIG